MARPPIRSTPGSPARQSARSAAPSSAGATPQRASRAAGSASQTAGKTAAKAAGKSAQARAGKPASTHHAPHAVRIIGGQWKRTPLAVVDLPGLRPTPDRVRETVFNWIRHLRGGLDGARVLDLFAGTGALGLEAASRGAAQVTLVEQQRGAVAALRASIDKLKAQNQVQLLQADALALLRELPAGSVDLVFVDPPYDAGLLPAVLTALPRVLTEDALIYIEDRAPVEPAPDTGWVVLRADRAGQVHFALLRLEPKPARDAGVAPVKMPQ